MENPALPTWVPDHTVAVRSQVSSHLAIFMTQAGMGFAKFLSAKSADFTEYPKLFTLYTPWTTFHVSPPGP